MSKEIYEKFKAKFPKEALSVDSSRGFDLTSIKGQYIRERLSDVVGVGNWKVKQISWKEWESQKTNKKGVEYTEYEVMFFGTLYIKIVDEWTETDIVGGDTSKSRSDAYKGALTNALGKGASNYGVGNEVYKGNVDSKTLDYKEPKQELESNKLYKEAVALGIVVDKEALKDMTEAERVKELKEAISDVKKLADAGIKGGK